MMDRRVRLRPKPAGADYVYGDLGGLQPTMLTILRTTNGMVWNYTPTITENRLVNYEFEQPTHSNAGFNNYKNTPNALINVMGDFTASTGLEATYLLACINFLRSSVQMDFGRKVLSSPSPQIAVLGAPPPILLFSAYGRYMYNDVPVLIKNFNMTFANDVDYVQVPVDSSNAEFYINSLDVKDFYQNYRLTNPTANPANNVYVPQKMQISVQLEVQPTQDYMSKTFNLNAFKRGELLRNGGII